MIYIKFILFFLLLSTYTFCQSNNPGKFKLDVTFENKVFSDAVLSYQNMDDIRNADTVKITRKRVFFSNQNFEPSWTYLKLIGKDTVRSYSFYMDTGHQKINVPVNGKIKIFGSRINKQDDSLSANNGLYKNKAISFIQNNPSNILSLHLIYNLISQRRIGVKLAYDLYNATTYNKNSRIGKILTNELYLRYVPRLAPDFKINDSLSLKDFRKKYVLIDFWASWCIPCREETPKLKILKDRYKDKLEIITISIDEDTAKWEKAILKDNIQNWTNLLRDKNIKEKYFNNVEHPIPLLYFIDPNGYIIWNTFENSRDELPDILAKSIR